ncbi:hypothetical protein BYT27DRAFT_7320694 [Phlegmacium glaucopus]|nr:hypothetical protein BYT27DRAFT_7320694 [Phlegmacium glaucopus]
MASHNLWALPAFILMRFLVACSVWLFRGIAASLSMPLVNSVSATISLPPFHASIRGPPAHNKNIAVASGFGCYFGVYIVLVWTIR